MTAIAWLVVAVGVITVGLLAVEAWLDMRDDRRNP